MARVLNKDARRRKQQRHGGWKELRRRPVWVSRLSPWTPQKSGSACSSAAGRGWGKVRGLWNVPSALDGLQLRHWSWGSQRRGIQTPSLPIGSARILSAGLSFLKGMVPRLGLGRET